MGKRVLTKDEENQIIYNYTILKMSQKNSGAFIKVSDKVVKRVLKENNIPIRTQGESRQKYFIKKDYFLNQTPNMAYILGLLASDGCVHGSKNLIYIELQRNDKELLEKVNKELENTRPIKDYESTKGYLNSKLWFYSKEAKDQLKEYHIIPNKTYSNDFKFPETLKEEFYIDYIRGLFDGDGSIKDTNCTPTWQIDSSSKDIIENIQQILLKYNIETKIQEKQSKNIPLYRIYCYGQKKCRKIYELLYNNAEIFMARKKEKFENLLK